MYNIKEILIPRTQLMILYRIYNRLFLYKMTKPFGYLFYYITRIIFSCDIHPNCKIGKGTQFIHSFNIVIGKGAIVGEYCSIFNGVSLGEDGVSDFYPIISNNVTLGTGSKIIGKVTIGENCIIGANSVVVKCTIPENCLVAGIPAKIIKKININNYKRIIPER